MNKESKIDLLKHIYIKLMEENNEFYIGNSVLFRRDIFNEKGIYIDCDLFSCILKLFKEYDLMGDVVRHKPNLEDLDKIYLKIGYKQRRLVLYRYPNIKTTEEILTESINKIINKLERFNKHVSRAVSEKELNKLLQLEEKKKELCREVFGAVIQNYFYNEFNYKMFTFKEYKIYYKNLLSYDKRFFEIEKDILTKRESRKISKKG